MHVHHLALKVCLPLTHTTAMFVLFEMLISPVKHASHRALVRCEKATPAELAPVGVASPQCSHARLEVRSTGLIAVINT